MSTSQKHRCFVAEPMGDKLVTELPGIGLVLGRKLASNGCSKAKHVFGRFLMYDEDETKFVEWLKTVSDANARQSGDCYQALATWSEQFL